MPAVKGLPRRAAPFSVGSAGLTAIVSPAWSLPSFTPGKPRGPANRWQSRWNPSERSRPRRCSRHLPLLPARRRLPLRPHRRNPQRQRRKPRRRKPWRRGSRLLPAAKRAVPPEGKKEEGEPAPVEPAAKEAPEGKAEPKEAAAAAEPAAAKEGKAPAEGGKAKGEEAPGAPATPASPQQDPAFQAVIGRARSVAHQQGHSE